MCRAEIGSLLANRTETTWENTRVSHSGTGDIVNTSSVAVNNSLPVSVHFVTRTVKTVAWCCSTSKPDCSLNL